MKTQGPGRLSALIRGSLHKWLYLVGGLLAVVSIFLPWWSLHADGGSIATNQGSVSLASFDFGIGPTGANIQVQLTGRSVPIVDPTGLLAVISIIIAFALFPVSTSLVLAFVNGVYCPLRNRIGQRLLVAPLWILIALFWWFFYFFSIDNALGGNLQPTGAANVALGKYRLGTVTWGWGLGLWLAIVSVVLFVAAFGFSSLLTGRRRSSVGKRMGFHSIGLLILGSLNLVFAFGLLLLASIFGSFGPGAFLMVPPVLLFGMAFLARTEVSATVSSQPLQVSAALPKALIPRTSGAQAVITSQAPLLKENISFKKAGELVKLNGQLWLYEDGITVKFGPRIPFTTARVPVGEGQNIPFSHITNIGGVTRTRLFGKNAEIEVGTDLGVTWEITGDQRLYTALQSAYQAWKGKNQR
jgi:hypothetical protein